MPDRRDVLTLGGAAALAALTVPRGVWASTADQPLPTLQTRLFNFKDDASPEAVADTISKLKAFNTSSAIDGFLIGKNLIPTPFPTRFEWIYMVQFDTSAPRAPADFAAFQRAAEALASQCRNAVECDLDARLPAKFANAPGVGVRHTVMFDFKADASPEAQERNVAAIRSMGQLPMVQHYVVEKTAAYRSDPTQMEWQVIGDFATVADYHAYSNAPVHLAIRDDFTAHTSRVAFLDVAL
jgi:hypothetical protein